MKIAVAGGNGTVGRHVAEEGRRRGHDVVVLSRRSGQDVVTGAGLDAALAGADAVVDVASVMTTSAARAVAFFGGATRNLLAAEERAGIRHHVALSIVGIDDIDASYYAGKLAQERMLAAGAVPWTLLRAAQFHEFAEQMLRQIALGPIGLVPRVLLRPVAAREVGIRLVDLAESAPAGRATDLVGPRDEVLADLVRRMRAFDADRGPTLELRLPGTYFRGLASGALRGTGARMLGAVTFDEWLRSPDHTPRRR
jgi:uncharacterized protein YbjT (DUF2867 family)